MRLPLVKACLVVLFALTQRGALNVIFGAATVTVWLLCADYYLADSAANRGWLSWVYLAVPFALILILSIVTAVQIAAKSRISRRAEGLRSAPSLCLPGTKEKELWREMLSDLAMAYDGIAQKYVLWIRSYFGSWTDRIQCVGWVPGYWFVLISIITIPGLRSRTMELVATTVARVPPSPFRNVYTGPRLLGKIDGIDVYLLDSGKPYGPWHLRPDPDLATFVLNEPGNGTLAVGENFKFTVYSGDFPRVGRRIRVRLLQRACRFMNVLDEESRTETLDVIAGKCTFRLHCPTGGKANSAREFQVSLDLLTQYGQPLWTSLIY